MELKNILKEIRNIGGLILNNQGEVIFKNNMAERYIYYLDPIIYSIKQGAQFFSTIYYPAEISTFTYKEMTVVLIKPLDKLVRLTKEKESLQELRSELNEVINSSFDGIVIADKNGVIIHQNPAYEKITGLSVNDLIGRSLRELEKENVIDSSSSLKALKDNKEVTIIQKINTGTTVLVSAVPIRNKNGEIKKIVNNVRDLSHLNNLEAEIKKLEEQNHQIHQELEFLRQQSDPNLSIIAHSDSMKNVLNRSLKIAHIDSGVIIQGASGVGKEKIVDLIHQNSFRKEYPLIKVNCGAIPESLLESELFGYVSGAFTGANQRGKAGLFEAASHGTIFLDEIGEMNKELQVKLLRVIQEQQVTRVGGTKPVSIDVRIIAATHRDLPKMIEAGEFREDLYYRLNVIPIHIPPLKDRKEDIIPLIYHFLKDIEQKYGVSRKFTTDALNTFQNHDWPGNVRELQNLVERVALMSPDPKITVDDLQRELQINPSSSAPAINYSSMEPLKKRIESYEADIIQDTVAKFPSVRKAATALKVDQSTLVRKMKKYKIET
ncbi:sigma-54 interaction domain-containing protein [Virgibacillus ainsalahensis]